jgi:long-chain acyl-CoA synthetase
MFTSGSTGPAKGVTHSFASMSHVFAAAAAALELTEADVLLPASSMSHIGAMLFGFAALSVGGRVAVAHHLGPEEVVPLLRRARPTVLCMLPAALFSLIRGADVTGDDFASLRLVRCGADKVPAELEAEFVALTGILIDEGYGCTEVGLATLNPPSGRILPGSVGQPLPGFELSLRDQAGREVAPGAEGEVWVRSRSRMSGYWEDPAATEQVVRDGWLNSGDVMRSDGDGYLWFCGRKKQIIVHDGSNIFPQEVEDALLLHPDVESAGVIGLHDLLHGENVRAYVVLKPGRRGTEAELIRFARQRVGYKAPEEIEFLDEMPLNPTGKTDRVRLKQMAAGRHLPHGVPA